jgi:hypothetical protein
MKRHRRDTRVTLVRSFVRSFVLAFTRRISFSMGRVVGRHARLLVRQQLVLLRTVGERRLVASVVGPLSTVELTLQIKSMAHHLHTSHRFQIDRRHRFSYHFCDDITTLLRLIIRELLDRQHQSSRNGVDGKSHLTQLNNALAFFINDCLVLMDRTFVFSLIKIYCKEVRRPRPFVRRRSLVECLVRS